MTAPVGYQARHSVTMTVSGFCYWCRSVQHDLIQPLPDTLPSRWICREYTGCNARHDALTGPVGPSAPPPPPPPQVVHEAIVWREGGAPESISGRSEPRTVLPVGFAHHVTWHHDDHGIYATCLPCGPARHHIEDGHPTAALVRFDTEHST